MCTLAPAEGCLAEACQPQEHLAAARAQTDNGNILLVGVSGNPPEGATFIWKETSEADIKAFVDSDPYVTNGLVPSWDLKPFTLAMKSF